MHTNQSALVTGTDEEEIQSGLSFEGLLLLDLFFLLTVGGGESNSTFSLL
jgi:hypothetical protein